MVKVTIELPNEARMFNGDDHKNMKPLAFGKMDSEVLSKFLSGQDGAIIKALRVVAMNAYNSGGKDATPAVKTAQYEKRLASWEGGDWAIVERGESQYTAMREVWIDDYRARTNATVKETESFIRDRVETRLGKDTKATFSAFLDATALDMVDAKQFPDTATARDAIEAHLTGLVESRDAERAKAVKKVAMPAFDLAAFKKPTK
jgi:hypothetical protein